MFRELGPDARELLGVAAFFPQGVNEENVDWLFPAISDAQDTFDTFCVLSLTYRSNGFITMLAPLRDHLRPKDLKSSALLNATKECYLSRLGIHTHPNRPGFQESRWITSEDVNIEHLLDVFTSIDPSSEDIWGACADFMNHLFWHKPRLVIMGPKIEALLDDHPSKPRCLYNLSRLYYSAGNWVEHKRLLTPTIKLWREQGDESQVAQALIEISEANRQMHLFEEGIQRAREASEIFGRLGDTARQAECLIILAYVLCGDRQLDTAEEAASRAIDLLPEKGKQYQVCLGYRVLGEIYHGKGDTEKAIHHFEVALGVASSLNLDAQLFWSHYSLAQLFSGGGRLDDAHAHLKHAKSHAVNNAYNLACAMELQANFWYKQRKFARARFEASRAADVYKKIGATEGTENCREFLRSIDELDFDGELMAAVLFHAHINFPFKH